MVDSFGALKEFPSELACEGSVLISLEFVNKSGLRRRYLALTDDNMKS